MTGKEELERLMAGNRRFIAGELDTRANEVDLEAHLGGQSPLAALVCCSDSRVPPEHIFNASFGEIFVVRVAGNVAGPTVLGSVEYAVAGLKVPLLMVLGHEGCGAVSAAIRRSGTGAINSILYEISMVMDPADAGRTDEKTMSKYVEANVRHTMDSLMRRSDTVANAVNGGQTLLAGAVYCLNKGEVRLL